ncbi:MAG: LysR substrate-binding domain-containing protein [Actinopolymorphaceae bacterium]
MARAPRGWPPGRRLERARIRPIDLQQRRTRYQLVTLACTSASFIPDVAHHADEWDTGAALVARGFGVALIPRLVELAARHDTRRVPVGAPPVPIRRVVATVRAGSREQPAIAAGLQALRQACDSLSTTLGHVGIARSACPRGPRRTMPHVAATRGACDRSLEG